MKDFSIKFRKLIEGKYFGSFQSIFKGSGIEVTDFREYVIGDAFRTINWKLSAKHDELFVNEFHRDQEIELDIFLDINYNWRGGLEKKNHKIFMDYFADIIVYCHRNTVNLNIFYPEMEKSKYKIKKLEINRRLELAYDFINKIPKLVERTPKKYLSLNKKILEECKQIKKRRAIMIFSDFLDLNDKDLKIINFLDRKHALFLMRVDVNFSWGQGYDSFFVKKQTPGTEKSSPISHYPLNTLPKPNSNHTINTSKK